jgi:tRNA dimethylallyltransferase
MTNREYNLLVVLGPTASGKTRLGVALARELGGEIVSADSRQVYRRLDIGAGKDLAEYGDVPYHLIDVAGLEEEFHLFRYQQMAYAAIEDCHTRERLPVVVGGTGLYLDAVLRGYRMVEAPEDTALRAELADCSDAELAERLRTLKPDLHNTTDLTDRDRTIRAIEITAYTKEHPPEPAPELTPLVLGVHWPRVELRGRIAARLKDRLDHGLIEEVDGLIAGGVSREKLHFLGLEYRYVSDLLDGTIGNHNDLYQKLFTAIAQFAKRQETWFRRMERQGVKIHWIDRGDVSVALRITGDNS